MKKITIPGSKSISNRALLLAALSSTPTTLKNLLTCDDTQYLKAALTNFGVRFKQMGTHDWQVIPPEKLQGHDSDNFIGNGGTPARFLVALSTLVEGNFTLRGVDRLHERPFNDLFEAVESLGITIEYLNQKGNLPARFKNESFETEKTRPSTIKISGKTSSQFTSALLLTATRYKAGLIIEKRDHIPSRPYVEMTIAMLNIWGITVSVSEDFKHFSINPSPENKFSGPETYTIPADCSAASYPMIYSVLSGKPLSIQHFGKQTLQGDEQFLEIIKKSGAEVQRVGEHVTIIPGHAIQSLGKVNFSKMPDVSMSGMVLAALAPVSSVSHFTGLESLRVKECDRIKAMIEGLRHFGVLVEELGDDVIIHGGLNQEKAQKRTFTTPINTYDDHRIAMVFGILREVLKVDVDITNQESVAKSWPGFWSALADWGNHLRSVAGVIIKKQETYLIVRKPRKNHAWQFPQGGVDTGETDLQAAQRELREECGNQLQAVFRPTPAGAYQYLFPDDFKRHQEHIKGANITFFQAQYVSGAVQIDGKEIIEHQWVTKENLDQYFEPIYLEKIKYFL